jgi:hypothetical protein
MVVGPFPEVPPVQVNRRIEKHGRDLDSRKETNDAEARDLLYRQNCIVPEEKAATRKVESDDYPQLIAPDGTRWMTTVPSRCHSAMWRAREMCKYRVAILVLILLSPVLIAAAQEPTAVDQPMRFTLHRPCGGNGSVCGIYILAEGEITENSPSELETIARKLNFRPTVYFDSPGGSLFGGIMLGHVIRRFGLDTRRWVI